MNLKEIRQKVHDLNWDIAEKGLKTVDPKTGQQLMEYWLPDEIKEMLIAEHNRPYDGKTNIVLVKYFISGWTWWATRYEPRPDEWVGDFWGPVEGFVKETGAFNLKELRDTRKPLLLREGDMARAIGYLYVERDYHFVPMPLDALI